MSASGVPQWRQGLLCATLAALLVMPAATMPFVLYHMPSPSTTPPFANYGICFQGTAVDRSQDYMDHCIVNAAGHENLVAGFNYTDNSTCNGSFPFCFKNRSYYSGLDVCLSDNSTQSFTKALLSIDTKHPLTECRPGASQLVHLPSATAPAPFTNVGLCYEGESGFETSNMSDWLTMCVLNIPANAAIREGFSHEERVPSCVGRGYEYCITDWHYYFNLNVCTDDEAYLDILKAARTKKEMDWLHHPFAQCRPIAISIPSPYPPAPFTNTGFCYEGMESPDWITSCVAKEDWMAPVKNNFTFVEAATNCYTRGYKYCIPNWSYYGRLTNWCTTSLSFWTMMKQRIAESRTLNGLAAKDWQKHPKPACRSMYEVLMHPGSKTVPSPMTDIGVCYEGEANMDWMNYCIIDQRTPEIYHHVIHAASQSDFTYGDRFKSCKTRGYAYCLSNWSYYSRVSQMCLKGIPGSEVLNSLEASIVGEPKTWSIHPRPECQAGRNMVIHPPNALAPGSLKNVGLCYEGEMNEDWMDRCIVNLPDNAGIKSGFMYAESVPNCTSRGYQYCISKWGFYSKVSNWCTDSQAYFDMVKHNIRSDPHTWAHHPLKHCRPIAISIPSVYAPSPFTNTGFCYEGIANHHWIQHCIVDEPRHAPIAKDFEIVDGGRDCAARGYKYCMPNWSYYPRISNWCTTSADSLNATMNLIKADPQKWMTHPHPECSDSYKVLVHPASPAAPDRLRNVGLCYEGDTSRAWMTECIVNQPQHAAIHSGFSFKDSIPSCKAEGYTHCLQSWPYYFKMNYFCTDSLAFLEEMKELIYKHPETWDKHPSPHCRPSFRALAHPAAASAPAPHTNVGLCFEYDEADSDWVSECMLGITEHSAIKSGFEHLSAAPGCSALGYTYCIQDWPYFHKLTNWCTDNIDHFNSVKSQMANKSAHPWINCRPASAALILTASPTAPTPLTDVAYCFEGEATKAWMTECIENLPDYTSVKRGFQHVQGGPNCTLRGYKHCMKIGPYYDKITNWCTDNATTLRAMKFDIVKNFEKWSTNPVPQCRPDYRVLVYPLSATAPTPFANVGFCMEGAATESYMNECIVDLPEHHDIKNGFQFVDAVPSCTARGYPHCIENWSYYYGLSKWCTDSMSFFNERKKHMSEHPTHWTDSPLQKCRPHHNLMYFSLPTTLTMGGDYKDQCYQGSQTKEYFTHCIATIGLNRPLQDYFKFADPLPTCQERNFTYCKTGWQYYDGTEVCFNKQAGLDALNSVIAPDVNRTASTKLYKENPRPECNPNYNMLVHPKSSVAPDPWQNVGLCYEGIATQEWMTKCIVNASDNAPIKDGFQFRSGGIPTCAQLGYGYCLPNWSYYYKTQFCTNTKAYFDLVKSWIEWYPEKWLSHISPECRPPTTSPRVWLGLPIPSASSPRLCGWYIAAFVLATIFMA